MHRDHSELEFWTSEQIPRRMSPHAPHSSSPDPNTERRHSSGLSRLDAGGGGDVQQPGAGNTTLPMHVLRSPVLSGE